MRYARILLATCVASLAGCGLTQTVPPCLAVRPSLSIVETSDRGVRLSRGDTERLAIYLEQLERCANL